MQWQKLPLHEDWDYRYTVNLEGVLYNIRLYYSQRTSDWTMNLLTETGENVVGGVKLRSREPIRITTHKALTGIFWLEPKSVSVDNNNLHPSLINKYFNFYYGWGEVETPEVERVLVRNTTARTFSITSSLYPIQIEESLSLNRGFSSVDYDEMILHNGQFEDSARLSRSFLSLTIGAPDRPINEIEDNVSLSRSLVSVVPRQSLLKHQMDDDKVNLSRSFISVTVEDVLITYDLGDSLTLGRTLLGVSNT